MQNNPNELNSDHSNSQEKHKADCSKSYVAGQIYQPEDCVTV